MSRCRRRCDGFLTSLSPLAMTTTLLAARQVEVAEVARLKRLETSAPSRNLHIAVTDTGIGLTASDTTRVFEHFYRVANVP